MTRRSTRCVSILVCILLLGACSSSADDRSTTSQSSTPPTSAVPTRVLTLVTMNLLHGALCDDGAGHCDVTDRMTLLARNLEAAGCPDVVALEEVAPWWRHLLETRLPALCEGAY